MDASAIVLLALRILLAVVLYGFLGLAIYVIWRDMRSQKEIIIARQPIPITLTTVLDSPPLSRQFSCAQIILGRDEACDFPVSDLTVSSQHARLSYHQSQWWVEDMSSTNGTILNGVIVTTPVVITHGDELHLGQVGIKVIIGQTHQQQA